MEYVVNGNLFARVGLHNFLKFGNAVLADIDNFVIICDVRDILIPHLPVIVFIIGFPLLCFA